MRVQIADSDRQTDEKRLYVSNLPPKIDNASLRDIFSHYGTVLKAEVFRKESRNSKCFIIIVLSFISMLFLI